MRQKRFQTIVLLGALLLLPGCSRRGTSESGPLHSEDDLPSNGTTDSADLTGKNDTLVVFFSRAGENWQVGNVEKGNTRVVVDYILEEYPFADFEIVPLTPYPESYSEMLSLAQEEQADNARPSYIGSVTNGSDYENVILGYPIWNGTFPNIVLSFLDDYDFAGKTIYPFSTHGGSGLGNTVSRLSQFEPDATIGKSFSIAGSSVRSDSAKEEVIAWVDSLGLK